MSDIYFGLAVMALLSCGLFSAVVRLSRKFPDRACDVAALLTIVGIVVYIHYLWDTAALARLLPFSNLIVIGNWFLPATAILGGLAWRRIPGHAIRKGFSVGALLGTGVYAIALPLHGQPPKCEDQWVDGVCLQTSNRTCSAASAASLLRTYDINATEQEMADLCLTRQGTTWEGLYRGLKRKTSGTRWDVEVFEGDIQALRAKTDRPIILTVGLPKNAHVSARYTQEYGWREGQMHSVVLFSFRPDGRAVIGDPSVASGKEYWSVEDQKLLWRGRGLRLVPRQQRSPIAAPVTQVLSRLFALD